MIVHAIIINNLLLLRILNKKEGIKEWIIQSVIFSVRVLTPPMRSG